MRTQPSLDLNWLEEPTDEQSHLLPALIVGGIVGFGILLAVLRGLTA